MKILIACEYSGVIRDAFLAKGHDAYSCDLLPDENGETARHYECDVLEILDLGWDMMIAHPNCQFLCSSGLHWNKRVEGREEKTEQALAFVQVLMDANIDKICIENPIGRINTAIRKPDQYIQPHEYGHDASKRTGLWLKNLETLKPTKHIAPRIVDGKPRWGNQTDSGQNKLAPSATRWKDRSRTYTGWAEAMAEQWG